MNVDANLVDTQQKASFWQHQLPILATWLLLALPIVSYRLGLDHEAVRIAVALCLGLNVCVPHMS